MTTSNRGFALILVLMVVSGLAGLITLLTIQQDFQIKSQATIERNIQLAEIMDELNFALRDEALCTSNFANVDPEMNANWPAGPRKIANGDGSHIYLSEASSVGPIGIKSISFDNFTASDPTSTDPKDGEANLVIGFDLGAVAGPREVFRSLPMAVSLKGLAASPGQEDQLATCRAISSASASPLVCPPGVTLVSNGSEFKCANELALRIPVHSERWEMPCDQPNTEDPIFGERCQTLTVHDHQPRMDLESVNPANDPNTGFKLFEVDYTSKVSGLMRIHTQIPFRFFQNSEVEHAWLVGIYVKDNSSTTMAGSGVLGNPFPRVDINPADPGKSFKFIAGSSGNASSTYGFYNTTAGTKYKITVRLYQKDDPGQKINQGGYAGTIHHYDHYTFGFLEVQEHSISK